MSKYLRDNTKFEVNNIQFILNILTVSGNPMTTLHLKVMVCYNIQFMLNILTFSSIIVIVILIFLRKSALSQASLTWVRSLLMSNTFSLYLSLSGFSCPDSNVSMGSDRHVKSLKINVLHM